MGKKNYRFNKTNAYLKKKRITKSSKFTKITLRKETKAEIE